MCLNLEQFGVFFLSKFKGCLSQRWRLIPFYPIPIPYHVHFLLALLSNDLFDSRSWRTYEAHNPVVRLRLTWKSQDPALNYIFFWPEGNPETTFGVGIKCIEYSDTALNVGWECGWPGNLREIPLNTASPNLARRPNQLLQLPSFCSRIGRGRKSTNLSTE